MCRDEWNKHIDDGMDFHDFCPKWKAANVWLEWVNYATMCFSDGIQQVQIFYQH